MCAGVLLRQAIWRLPPSISNGLSYTGFLGLRGQPLFCLHGTWLCQEKRPTFPPRADKQPRLRPISFSVVGLQLLQEELLTAGSVRSQEIEILWPDLGSLTDCRVGVTRAGFVPRLSSV